MTRNEYEYPEAYGALSAAFAGLVASVTLALESMARTVKDFDEADDTTANELETIVASTFGPIYHLSSGLTEALSILEAREPGEEIPAVIERDQFLNNRLPGLVERGQKAATEIETRRGRK